MGLNSATTHIAIMYGIPFLHMPTCLAKRETYGYYSSVRQNWRQNKLGENRLSENESPPVKELQRLSLSFHVMSVLDTFTKR